MGGRDEMPLVFEGVSYDTIADVKRRFPVAEKTLNKLIAAGRIAPPETVCHGTRTFRHFSREWQDQLAKIVKPRNHE
jgi:hypothetical protein